MATFEFKTIHKDAPVVEVTLEAKDGSLTIKEIQNFLEDLTVEFSRGRNSTSSVVNVSERGLTVRLCPLPDD